MKPRARLPLVGVLAVTLLAELLTSRIGMRLAADFLMARSAQRALQWASAFSFNAATLLAVVLAGLAVVKNLGRAPAAADASSVMLAGRAAMVVAQAGFLFIAALGAWQPLPPQLRLYLVALFAVLVVGVVRSSWPATIGQGRVRVWLVLGAAAVLAHLGWMALSQLGLDQRLHLGRPLLTVGEALAATVAATAPFSLAARRSPRLVPALLGLALALAAVWVAQQNWMLAAKIAAYGFGMELPPPLAGVALEAVALGGWLAGVLALLAVPGTTRLRGYGLLLLGLSGYQLELPYQLCSSLLGVMCVVESYQRERATVLPAAAWQRLLGRLARAVGSRETVVVGSAGFEEARAAGSIDGVAVELVAERRGYQLGRFEAAVGGAPLDQAPPLSLLRRGMPRLGRRSGVEVATGDLDFDATFAVHDARKLSSADPLLDDAMRPRLRAAIDGWLGIWPGQGVRLRTAGARWFTALLDGSPAGDQELDELLALLLEVRRRG